MKKVDLAVHQTYLVRGRTEGDHLEGFLLDLDLVALDQAKRDAGVYRWSRDSEKGKVVMATRRMFVSPFQGTVGWGDERAWTVQLVPLNKIIEPLDRSEFAGRIRRDYEKNKAHENEVKAKREARRVELQEKVDEANAILGKPILEVSVRLPSIELRIGKSLEDGWLRGATMDDLVEAIIELGKVKT